MPSLMRIGLAVVMAVGALIPAAPVTAQQGAAPWLDRPSARPQRRDDAYRPNGSESSGLGTLDDREYSGRDPGWQDERQDPRGGYGGGYASAPPPGGYAPPPRYEPSYGGPRYGNAPPPAYQPPPAYGGGNDAYRPPGRGDGYGGGYAASNPGFGQPYTPPPSDAYDPRYGNRPYASGEAPPPYRAERRDGSFSMDEITRAGHGFFGSISQGLASVIEHTYRNKGRPNGYILGEEGGGAWIAGLRYGRGTLYTKDAGSFPVYWQGPSIGFDIGAAGSKTMILVYNLRDPSDVFDRFGGIDGSAYVVGGVGVTFLTKDHVTMAPIRSGVGLRLGANVGYLKFTDRQTWNPF